MQITLASSSVYRQALLKKLALSFDCVSPNIDESEQADEPVAHQVKRLAEQKAQAISTLCPTHYVIGSDQLAFFNGQKLGKPGNVDNAKKQLMQLSGNTVQFYTGLCVSHSGQQKSLVEVTEVHFRVLTESQIDTYLELERPFDCAGSFKSEGLGISLFSAISGRDPNSLIGLPLMGLIDLFAEFDISLLDYAGASS